MNGLHDVEQLFVLFSALRAALAGRIKSVNESCDELALFKLAVRSLSVIPVLVVVEFGPVLSETWLLDDLIATQLGSKVAWSIVVIEAAVTEMDVTVSPGAVGLASWNVLSAVKRGKIKVSDEIE